jgi:hypothetical protein
MTLEEFVGRLSGVQRKGVATVRSAHPIPTASRASP